MRRLLLVVFVAIPVSAVIAFPSAADDAAPTPPLGLAVTGAARTSVTLEWTASGEEEGAVAYDVFVDGQPAGTTATATYTVGALHCETAYDFGVRARDAAGNVSLATTVRTDTAACDRAPPSAPAGLASTAADQTTISVTWSASTDDDAVAGYEVSLDGAVAGTTGGTSYTVTGLGCGTAHDVAVLAIDPSGNRSAPTALRHSTGACPAPPADAYVAPDGKDFVPRWRHLAATFDGSAVRLYVDGVLVGERAASGSMAGSTGVLRLGGTALWGLWYRGVMDEVRVYARALTVDGIKEAMGTAAADPDGLVAAYSFEEGSGDVAADVSGNGNDGTLFGASWTPDGKLGGALAFDGHWDWMTVRDSPSLDLSSAMTLMAWVRPDDPRASWQSILVKEADGYFDYGLWASTPEKVPSAHVQLDKEIHASGPAGLTGTPCTASSPCATFERALDVLGPNGGVVEVAGGTYGPQTLEPDRGRAADAPVLFRPAAGEKVRIEGPLDVYASGLEIRDMTIAGPWKTHAETSRVTFRNVSAGSFFLWSSSGISMIGGEVGPSDGSDFDSQIANEYGSDRPPTDILFRGVWFHDWWRPEGSYFHTECVQVGSGVRLTFVGNTFSRCATHDIFIRSWGENHPLRDIRIESNVLGATLDGFFTVAVENDLGPEEATVLIRNNTSLQGFNLPALNANVSVIGNVVGWQRSFGCTAAVYRHNVYEVGDPCDETDLVSPVAFVDRDGLDLHLAPGSAAIDRGDPASYAADDLDGDARPLGGAPDAGADERG